MSTFQQMIDRIGNDYLNRSDLSAETSRAIIRAVRHYEKSRFWFNQTSTAIVIGTASVSVHLPSNFLAFDFATISVDGSDERLNLKSYDRISYNNRGGAQGVPSEVCYWLDAMHFSPMPSSATTITLHYTKSIQQMSAGTDTNAWTSAGEDVIVFHAWHDVATNILRISDKQLLESIKEQEMEAFRVLQFGNDIRLNSGEQVGDLGTQQSRAPKMPRKNPST